MYDSLLTMGTATVDRLCCLHRYRQSSFLHGILLTKFDRHKNQHLSPPLVAAYSLLRLALQNYHLALHMVFITLI